MGLHMTGSTLASLNNAFAGSLTATAVKTGAYTAAAGDLIPVDATSGAVTVTLPTAPPDRTRVAVKKIDSGANVVTVQRGGSSDAFNKAGGSTSVSLSLPNQAVNLQYSGGIWYVVSDDLSLASLNGIFPRVVQVLANGTDQTAQINAALAGAAPVGTRKTVKLIGDFTITAPLVIADRTNLDCYDASITQAAGSPGMMLVTSTYNTTGARNTDIRVSGGKWDRGANVGSLLNTMNIVMSHVDRVVVEDITFSSTGGKYAVYFLDATDFIAQRIHFDNAFSDGVHITGPCSKGTVRDITGVTWDDFVAITASDYHTYIPSTLPNNGDVTDILIENIKMSPGCRGSVKVLAGKGNVNGLPHTVDNITIRNVKGETGEDPGVNIFSDIGQAETTGGIIGRVTVEDVQTVQTSANYNVYCNVNTALLVLRNIAVNDATGVSRAVKIDGVTGAITVNELRASQIHYLTNSTSPNILVGVNATIQKMVLDGFSRSSAANTGYVVDVFGKVLEATIDRGRTILGETVLMIEAGGQVDQASLVDVSASTASYLVRNNGSRSVSVNARDVDTGGAPVVRISGASATAALRANGLRTPAPAFSFGAAQRAKATGQVWADVTLLDAPQGGDTILNTNATALPVGLATFSAGKWRSNVDNGTSTYTPAAASVMTDTFTRSGELSGSSPDTGPSGGVWEGVTGKWTANGTRLVPAVADGSAATFNTKVAGEFTVSGTIRCETQTAASRSIRVYLKAIDFNNGIRLGFTLTNGGNVAIAYLVGGSATSVNFATAPIPSNAAAADYAFSVSVSGNTLTAVVNGNTQTLTIPNSALGTLAYASKLILTSTDLNIQFDNLTITTP